MHLSHTFLVAAIMLAGGTAVSAQTSRDPWEDARFRLGPLAFTPKIALTSFGIDTNVFNQPVDPKDDWTFTLVPSVDWWLRAGPLRLNITNAFEGVYYHQYETERAINQRHSGWRSREGSRIAAARRASRSSASLTGRRQNSKPSSLTSSCRATRSSCRNATSRRTRGPIL